MSWLRLLPNGEPTQVLPLAPQLPSVETLLVEHVPNFA